MSEGLTLSMFAAIVFCVLIEAAREICFKKAADDTSFAKALAKPITWLGIGFWCMELVVWTIVLEHVPLSIAFPLGALSYVAMVLAGALVLKEPVNMRHGIGALLITAGAACVGATGV